MLKTDCSELVKLAAAENGVTGASFAYWDGSELHTAVAGVRNSVTRDPVTTDTVMHLGSITKVLNAALLMQVVEEGLVSLNDPVIKYLPDLRLKDTEALGKLTVKMLVNHTGGINDEMLGDHGPDRERIEDAVDRCAEMEQLHHPGEGPSYSNIGTVIAGYLVQRVRGVSWYSIMKQRIFEPLEMHNALSEPTDVPLFRCSVGDLTDYVTGQMKRTTKPFLPQGYAPCGTTLMSTASDLVTFARAMIGGGVGPNGARILSEDSAQRMATPTAAVHSPENWYWGLGWMILPGGVLHHSGGGPGVSSFFYAHPSSGRAFALLTNCDKGALMQTLVINPILESWTGIPKSVRVEENIAVNPSLYEGTYEGAYDTIEVFPMNGSLAMQERYKRKFYDNDLTSNSSVVELTPIREHVFEAQAPFGHTKIELKFVNPDASGRMGALATGLRVKMRTR